MKGIITVIKLDGGIRACPHPIWLLSSWDEDAMGNSSWKRRMTSDNWRRRGNAASQGYIECEPHRKLGKQGMMLTRISEGGGAATTLTWDVCLWHCQSRTSHCLTPPSFFPHLLWQPRGTGAHCDNCIESRILAGLPWCPFFQKTPHSRIRRA